jgi:hypothetical protein
VSWLEGLITDASARQLLAAAARQPANAAAAHHQPLPGPALDVVNAELAATAVPARLAPATRGLRREWLDPADRLDWLLGPITRSAADLLTSPPALRPRRCGRVPYDVLTVTFSIQTDCCGVSPLWPPTGTLAILSITARPSTTSPKAE